MYSGVLTKNLHKIFRQDPFIAELNHSIGQRLDSFGSRLADFLLQLDIETATWALLIYEKECGIVTDPTKTLEDRRAVIKSKMRGSGKADAALIQLVVNSWTNGGVDISFEDGVITVTFNDVTGIPSNMNDVKAAIELVKPAHLPITFIFNYMTWDELDAKGLTWNELDALGLTWDEFEKFT
ncbi:putative phage tail protein [Paenibacillus sp. MMS18-CY102]|uniref:putative phage tail protein n=1 Tax=Paenibacillus sp. MMS18-CY102 TaxID=2682849 RepID=UPI001365EC87|nr:putative phage tail protein [Paenibacillus sp. MMS18-CY102]MWC26624.1 DUF2313 domain-containing protein [Paenibacillus sp. MMS18-CY102]